METIANRYQVERLLGEGGMGKVFLVKDTVDDRQLALKLLKGGNALQLKQEFFTMTRLRHPNALEVFDFGQLNDGCYFTMEFVAGEDLDEKKGISPEKLKEVLVEVLRALGAIHQQGFVHCDIKPQNIRLTETGLKLMDFGLMEPIGRTHGPVKGTVFYFAPEVIKGGRVDQRSDLYSLGAVAFHLLTGHPPFEGDLSEVIDGHLNREIEKTGTFLDPFLRKLTAKNPLERFQSADEALIFLGSPPEQKAGVLLSPPFTGREDELELIENHLVGVSKGMPARPILLVGESGVGKSRLLDEFRFKVQLSDIPFLSGNCREGNEASCFVPFLPFVSILRQIIPLAKSRQPEILERLSPRLAKLLPEMSTRSVEELEPKQEKVRLFAAFQELLTSILPAVLAIEDVQWLDEASRELLEYLLRNSKALPLLLIATSTSSESSFPLSSHLNLSGFSRPECGDFVASILGGEAPKSLLAWLEEKANGNPLFIEGMLRHIQEKGSLYRKNEEWRVDEAFHEAALPDGLRDLLLERIRTLSVGANDLACALAVLGRSASLEMLSLVSPQEEIFASLDELERLQVLDRVEGNYFFRQSLMPVILYQQLPDSERRLVHARIAEVLEGEGYNPSAEHLNALARHTLEAGMSVAVRYALAAARANQRLYALAEAERLLEAGLTHLEDKDEVLLLDYHHLLGDIQRTRSRYPEALLSLQRALELAHGDLDKSCNILTSLGKIHQVLSHYSEAMGFMEKAMGLCERTCNRKALARCHTTAGRITFFLGDPQKSNEHYAEAWKIAKEIDNPALVAESVAFLGFMAVSDGRFEAGMEFLKQSLSIKESLGDKFGLIDTLMLLGNARLSLGELEAAQGDFTRCRELAHETGLMDEEIFAGINLSLTAIERGDFRLAAGLAEEALFTAEGTGSKFAIGSALTLKALAQAHRGEIGEALEEMANALDIGRETNNRYLETFTLIYQTEMLALLGNWGEALDCGMAAKSIIQETGNHEGELTLFAAMGEIYSFLGECELAEGYIEKAKNLSRERGLKGALARALKAQAVMECRREGWEKAQQSSREAIALAQEIGARFLEGSGKWLLGEASISLGRREKAWENFQSVLQIARETGSRALELLGVRGLAGSDPSGGSSHLKRFQKLLEEMLRTLTPQVQETFRKAWNGYSFTRGKEAFSPEELDEQAIRLMDQMQGFTERLRGKMGEWSNLKKSHRNLEELVNFSLAVNRIHTLDEVLNRTVELIVELTGSERGFLLLYRDGQLQCRAVKNIHENTALDWQLSEGIAKEVLLSEEPLCVFDALTDERFRHQELVQLLHLRTVICVPLKIHDQAVGVIYVDRQSVNEQFSQEDLDLVFSLANQAANAVENGMLHDEWADKSRKLEMLNTLSRTVSNTLVSSEVNELVLKLTLEVTDAERGFLFMNEEGQPHCVAAFDRDGQKLDIVESPVSQSIINRVLRENEPAIILDALADETLQFQASIMALNLRTVMCVPLNAKEKTVGLLYVDSQAVRSFTGTDLELLEAIASHASIAVENANLYTSLSRRAKELEVMVEAYEEATLRANIDFLTGIYNRRHFIDAFKRDFDQARRHDRSLAMMMIDIDHFRSFNDTYGHQAGDSALQAVAKLIQQAVRTVDVVARYGGEEFIVGLPDTDLEGAMIVAERIRASVESFPMESVAEGSRHLTVSIGTSLASNNDQRIAELIERADHSLYEAKKQGRNRIIAD